VRRYAIVTISKMIVEEPACPLFYTKSIITAEVQPVLAFSVSSHHNPHSTLSTLHFALCLSHALPIMKKKTNRWYRIKILTCFVGGINGQLDTIRQGLRTSETKAHRAMCGRPIICTKIHCFLLLASRADLSDVGLPINYFRQSQRH